MTIATRLEQYTLKRPGEVLLVSVAIATESGQEPDQIVIFKGFSSSLMRPTEYDPDVPVLPADAEILTIDRLHGPYNPDAPRYIQQGLTWDDMQSLLAEVGL
ncbi:MAG TPA: hypothetical protein V6C88_18930 [Chroococcidiopsis sp.]